MSPTVKVAAVESERLNAAFSALSSPHRREVLRILADAGRDSNWAEDQFGARAGQLRGASCCGDEVCACCFTELLGLAPSTVSHHMHRLVEAGLVEARKDGLWVYYRLERAALEEVAQALREVAS
jgi:DNA-binding transcriptional ArsR family regulator